MRIWIDLSDAPSVLFEQARHGGDAAFILARRHALFSYFGASVETKEEAERLVFALAARLFPAFRVRSEKPRKHLGRPPAFRPKYEVEFLERVAEAYDKTKTKVKIYSTIPTARIYQLFLKDNPRIANEFRVQGKPLQLGSFKKLLTVGRSARKYMALWHRDFLGVFPAAWNARGEYITIYHDRAVPSDFIVSPLWLDLHLVYGATLPETDHQAFEKQP